MSISKMETLKRPLNY